MNADLIGVIADYRGRRGVITGTSGALVRMTYGDETHPLEEWVDAAETTNYEGATA